MTFPDPNLQSPLDPGRPNPDNRQDIVPPSERNEDLQRDQIERGLTLEGSRPLTDDEKKAADRDMSAGERVYAPASERVPVDPVPGHREFVEHTDTHTAERERAAGYVPPAQPTFGRVARPEATSTPTPGAYASPMSNPGLQTHGLAGDSDADRSNTSRRAVFFGVGLSSAAIIGAVVGVWLFKRWQRERNKPINRLRRQALLAATELRERMPAPAEAARPAMGVTTALLSLLLVLWRQSQAQTRPQLKQTARLRDRATEAVSDGDWQQRLIKLKERWTPHRLELEKSSISRH